MTRQCYDCGTTHDLRPYGPNGSWVCYKCATSTPEREQAAMANMHSQMSAIDGPFVIGLEEGPVPLSSLGDMEVVDLNGNKVILSEIITPLSKSKFS